MKNVELKELGNKYIMETYGRYDLCITKGEGSYVYDVEGNRYLDFVSGIAVMALGHGYKKVTDVIKVQCETLMQCSNLFWIEPQIRFAKLLVENSFADRAFFCNSGAEANEAAIKLARKYSYIKYGENKYEIITMKNSFHGRTMAAVTATAQPKYHKGFYPLLPGFSYVPYNDIDALLELMSESTCAVMIEPIQGEGGVSSADISYMKSVRELCDKYNALLIFDEIQCGLGRTGKLFAYEHFDVTPDIMTLAKSLGGGVPMGCCLANEEVGATFKPGDHASTFGGNPLASSTGFAAVSALLEDGIIENAANMGELLKSGLMKLQSKYEFIKEVRGMGLLIGAELDMDVRSIIIECQKKGLLICNAGAKVLRFLPPLTVCEAEINEAIIILDEVLGEVL